MRAFTRFLFVVLVAKFEFAGFRKQKKYRAYDRFHRNVPYGKIPTKKEQIRMHGFTSRLPCHIINICYLPAGRSVLGKTVPEVLSTARGRAEGRAQDGGHSFSQYRPTKAGK